jgi:hypothetical protein
VTALRRFRWHAVAVAWIVCLAGWATVVLLPDRHEATAVVRIEPDALPARGGESTVYDRGDPLWRLRQVLFTHDVLRRVVARMAADASTPSIQDPAEAIHDLAGRIALEPGALDRTFVLHLRDDDPARAIHGLQVLLTVLSDVYPGVPVVPVVQAPDAGAPPAGSGAADADVSAAAARLRAAEAALADYRQRDPGGVNPSRTAGAEHAEEYTALVTQTRAELKSAEAARDGLRKRAAAEREWIVKDVPAPVEAEAPPEPPPSPDLGTDPETEARIRAVRESLEQMKLKYTDEHPDVIAARHVLELLVDQRERRHEQARHAEEERRAQRERAQRAARAAAREHPAIVQTRERNPVYEQLAVALAQQEANANALRAKLAEYERAAAASTTGRSDPRAPRTDETAVALTAAVEQAKLAHAEAVVRRDAAARSPAAAVRPAPPAARPAAEPIRLVEPIRAASVAALPTRSALVSMVLCAGVLAGLATASILGRLRPVFHDVATLGKMSGLPVLGSVSSMSAESGGRGRIGAGLAYTVACLALLGCYAAMLGVLTHGARLPN